MVKVKKRNGKIVDYDDSKVFRAIQLANKNSVKLNFGGKGDEQKNK
jgi:hypothetical protein